jgi:hypothetical protein
MVKKSKHDYNPNDVVKATALMVTTTNNLRVFAPTFVPQSIQQPEVRWVIDSAQKYLRDHGKAPSFDILRSLVEADRGIRDEDRKLLHPFIDDMEERKPRRAEEGYYREKFQEFLQASYIGWTVKKVVAHVEEGDIESAEATIRESVLPTVANIQLLYAPDDVASVFAKRDEIERVPVGIPAIDHAIGGGCESGELMVWLAPTGYGKSMALVNTGTAAWQQGFNVIHFSFENSAEETLSRYIGNMTGVPVEVLDAEGGMESTGVRELLVVPGCGKIAIARLVGRHTDVDTLLSHLYTIVDVFGFDPHAIIVDYGDLMKPTIFSGEKTYIDLERIFQELKDLAVETGLPIFTATQSNREGKKARRVKIEHTGGAYAKMFNADLIISLSRPDKDEIDDDEDDMSDGDVAELKIAKFRRGKEPRKIFKVRCNFSVARLEEIDADAEDDRKDERASKKRTRRRKAKDEDDE